MYRNLALQAGLLIFAYVTGRRPVVTDISSSEACKLVGLRDPLI